jgi:hypothetical protein
LWGDTDLFVCAMARPAKQSSTLPKPRVTTFIRAEDHSPDVLAKAHTDKVMTMD